MKVIETKDISREGNDCWIYESISLCEEFDKYFIIRCWKVTGWADREEISIISEFMSDLVEAKDSFRKVIKDGYL